MITNEKDLSLYISLNLFLCNINEDNYKENYEILDTLAMEGSDIVPVNIAIWEPFIHFEISKLVEEIDMHAKFILDTLKIRMEFKK